MARKRPAPREVPQPEFAVRAAREESADEGTDQAGDGVAEPKKLRGRPPMAPRTALAGWIQAEGITATDFIRRLHALAPVVEAAIRKQYPAFRISSSDIPTPKNLLDAANGRHRPRLLTVVLVTAGTGGKVGPSEWVADMSRHGLS